MGLVILSILILMGTRQTGHDSVGYARKRWILANDGLLGCCEVLVYSCIYEEIVVYIVHQLISVRVYVRNYVYDICNK